MNSQTLLNDQEIVAITRTNCHPPHGYNLTLGGNNFRPSAETRAKISKALKGRKSQGRMFKKGLTPWNKGKPWSQQMKEKLSRAHIGLKRNGDYKMTAEHKQNLSAAARKRNNSHLYKPIFCITNGKNYESALAASKALGVSRSKICCVLKGIRKHTKGFIFEYAKKTK